VAWWLYSREGLEPIPRQHILKMTDPADSAISRTPIEIWWKILDQIIDCPTYFATVYNGDDWAHDAQFYSLKKDEQEYRGKAKERWIVASVCRSWRHIVTQRKERGLSLGIENRYPSYTEVNRAHRVFVGMLDKSTLLSIGQSVDWRILRVGTRSTFKDLYQVSFPHLRRLIVSPSIYTKLYPTLKLYGSLVNLTWLEYSVTIFYSTETNQNEETILLPNLQVFIYVTRRGFEFPFASLDLPLLQHLSIRHEGVYGTFPPVVDFLLPCRRTLRSASIVSEHTPLRPSSFLHWEELPLLRELVLDGSFPLQFHPLPHNHPLKKLYVRHYDVKDIFAWMDSDNLRQIRLLEARWDHGVLVNSRGAVPIDRSEMEELLEKADMRGICFEAGSVLAAIKNAPQ
jgi:hypothetical protein